jgi:hypothetical protein
MNFSTVPPYRPMIVPATSKYSDSSSRTASGSRDSASGVNPTRSQNSTEHTRRSATGPPAAVTAPARTPAVGNADPQAWQKRPPGTAGSPHDGHPSTGAPHSTQNR